MSPPSSARATSAAHIPRSSVASPGCARTSGRSGQVAVVITARSPLDRGNQEPRFCEPLESAAGDVAVNLLGGGDLVGRHRHRLRTGEQERLAKLAIADQVKAMHHFLETW